MIKTVLYIFKGILVRYGGDNIIYSHGFAIYDFHAVLHLELYAKNNNYISFLNLKDSSNS